MASIIRWAAETMVTANLTIKGLWGESMSSREEIIATREQGLAAVVAVVGSTHYDVPAAGEQSDINEQ